MIIDRKAFFDGYRADFGVLSQSQVDGLEALLALIEADDLHDPCAIAYLLATIKHECADTWKPITERGTEDYFLARYAPSTKVGASLGNRLAEDAYVFRAHGFCGITGRDNFRRMGEAIGVNLVNNPALALVPEHAYRIATLGMARGMFTGKKLSDYIAPGRPADYVGARYVINGQDCAQKIADYAKTFERILRASIRAAEAVMEAQVGPVDTSDAEKYAALVSAVRMAVAELQRAIGDAH